MQEVLAAVEQSALATWVREAPTLWAYPTLLFLHTVGLGFLVGLNAAVDLRLLGVARQLPVRAMQRFVPFMWCGFWVNAVSGVLLLAADATTKLLNPVFGIKLLCVVLGMINLIWLKPRLLDGRVNEATVFARVTAVTSLLAWIGATVAGRLMGYLVPFSGTL